MEESIPISLIVTVIGALIALVIAEVTKNIYRNLRKPFVVELKSSSNPYGPDQSGGTISVRGSVLFRNKLNVVHENLEIGLRVPKQFSNVVFHEFNPLDEVSSHKQIFSSRTNDNRQFNYYRTKYERDIFPGQNLKIVHFEGTFRKADFIDAYWLAGIWVTVHTRHGSMREEFFPINFNK